jgi:hypothetical protein
VHVLESDPPAAESKMKKALEDAEIRKCADAALRKDPNVNGKLLLQVFTGESGAVERIDADTSTPRGSLTADFEKCVVTTVQGATFPHSKGSRRAFISFSIQADVLP